MPRITKESLGHMTTTYKREAPRWHTLDGRTLLVSKIPKRHLINIIVLLRSKIDLRSYSDNYDFFDAIAKRAYKLGITKYRSAYRLLINKKPDLEEIPFGYKWKNTATCRRCSDKIISKHRHDYVTCHCKAIAIDGGNDYTRRIGNPSDFV